MSVITNRPMGRVVEFPRHRTADGRRVAAEAALAERTDAKSPIEFGSSWYHEAAIEDARRGRPQ
jgi:hypothetical protein